MGRLGNGARALLRHRERGQMAWAMLFGIIVFLMFMAFALDAGMWYFDHRWAQSQAEAAAHAAVDTLPAPEGQPARATAIAKADQWLGFNGSSRLERTCPENDDPGEGNILPLPTPDTFNPAGSLSSVRVCVRRTSPSVFAQLAGINAAWVSAAATASVRMDPLFYALMAMQEPCDNPGNIKVSGGANVTLGGPAGTYTAANGCPTNIVVNSSGPDAGSTLTSGGDNDTDSMSGCTATPGTLTPDCTMAGRIPDPWASLQPRPQTGCLSFDSSDGANNPPGRYCGSVNIGSDNTVFLDCSGEPTRDRCFYTFTDNFTVTGAKLQYKPVPLTGAEPITLGSTSQGSATGISLPVPHTVPNRPDRMLIVGVVSGITTVNSVTYGSQPLTLIASGQTGGGANVKTSLYALADPAIGTNDIVISTAGSTDIVGMAATYYNVGGLGNDNSNAVNTSDTYSGVTIPSRTGQLIVDVVGINSTTATYAPHISQTTVLPSPESVGSHSGNMSSEPGASPNVLMNWSAGTPVGWASVGVALLPLSNEGITLYFTCDTSPCAGADKAGNVSLSGGSLELGTDATPLFGNPDYENMLFWVDRTSSTSPMSSVSIAGGADINLAGRVYGYHSNIEFTGNSNQVVALNLNILGNTLAFTGQATFNIDWDDDFAPTIRSISFTE